MNYSELEQQGVIEKVPDKARADRVSPIMVVPKQITTSVFV